MRRMTFQAIAWTLSSVDMSFLKVRALAMVCVRVIFSLIEGFSHTGSPDRLPAAGFGADGVEVGVAPVQDDLYQCFFVVQYALSQASAPAVGQSV
jgi:hypothetical protein